MTDQDLAREVDHIERWEVGGLAGAIAIWEARAVEAERRYASHPCKGGKRKAALLTEAADCRAKAARLRSAL